MLSQRQQLCVINRRRRMHLLLFPFSSNLPTDACTTCSNNNSGSFHQEIYRFPRGLKNERGDGTWKSVETLYTKIMQNSVRKTCISQIYLTSTMVLQATYCTRRLFLFRFREKKTIRLLHRNDNVLATLKMQMQMPMKFLGLVRRLQTKLD